MAKLHLLSGGHTRPWSEIEYKSLLDTDTSRFFHTKNGFLIGRIIDRDAEILNVIIHPDYRRLGNASKLIGTFEKKQNMQDLQDVFLKLPNRIAQLRIFIVHWAIWRLGKETITTNLLMVVKTMQ